MKGFEGERVRERTRLADAPMVGATHQPCIWLLAASGAALVAVVGFTVQALAQRTAPDLVCKGGRQGNIGRMGASNVGLR
jgi:hypothetical protein